VVAQIKNVIGVKNGKKMYGQSKYGVNTIIKIYVKIVMIEYITIEPNLTRTKTLLHNHEH
tara:strand:+ start:216 stop:395 length:180 start_codon:yes stop_codon:yes gene_type:complete